MLMLPYLLVAHQLAFCCNMQGSLVCQLPQYEFRASLPAYSRRLQGARQWAHPQVPGGLLHQLPFVDGSPEGRPSKFICSSLSLLHLSTAFLVASKQGELFVCLTAQQLPAVK